MPESNHYAEAAMLIRKPISEVFQAFINPDITTKFWFTKSSGKLEEGKTMEWIWEMYNYTVEVKVDKIVPNQTIIIEWGNREKQTKVEWHFRALDESKTFVSILNTGFTGTTDELISSIRDSTGGFSWLLAGAKAYLEYGIPLNLTADRFPKEMTKH